MNLDNIKQALQRLGALVEDCESRGVSDMERDLILKELRELYTAVRFGGEHPAPEPEPLQPSEPAPAPAVEKVLEDAPAAAEKETEEDTHLEPAPVVPAEPSPVEPAPAAEAEQTEETTVEQTAAPADVQKTEQPQDAEMLSLFSTDEIKVSRRRRMIVRSLYGDEVAPAAKSESAPAPAEPAAESVAESVDAPEPVPESVEAAELEDDMTILEIDDSISILSDIDVSSTEVEEPAAVPVSEPEPEPKPEPAPEYALVSEKKPEPRILGDTINSGVQTIGDTIRPHESAVAEAVANGHIDSLAEAIGINDRFLLIRDLFNGNSAEYEQAIARLDSFADENDCMIHIIETYDWNPYSEGAKLLMSLIERRYGSRA